MLPRSSLFGLSVVAAGLCAQADITIPIPADNASTNYQVGVDTASAGAKRIRNQCGAVYYLGHASSASLAEGPDSSLTLNYSLVYSSADGQYGTMTGILLPMTPNWDIKDLSAATSITYDVKAANPGLRVQLSIGSTAYPVDVVAENAALVSNLSPALTTSYTSVTVSVADLYMPTWMQSADGALVGWLADGVAYTIGVAPTVKDLNFFPVLDAAWNATGTGFKTTTAAKTAISNALSIRNVVIHGANPYPNVAGTTCYGPSFLVDDFAAVDHYTHQARSANSPNYLGGYWYAYTDTSADPARLASDSTVGSSRILLPTGATHWTPTPDVAAIVNAQLEKNSGVPGFDYRKYAGWATLGTDVFDANGANPANFVDFPSGNALTGIGFDLYAGPELSTVLSGATIDTDKVARIVFSVGKASVDPAAEYSVSIPLSQVLQSGGGQICVDPTQLRQPSGYERNFGVVPFTAEDLTNLSWKIQIEDQKDPSIHTSGPDAFAVANLRFYGVDSADFGVVVVPPPPPVDSTGDKHHRHHHPKPRHFPHFRAHYHHGLQVVFPDLRTGGRLDVVRQDGSHPISFKVEAGSIGRILPVVLPRGTYLVSLRLPGKRETLVVHVD